MGSASATAAGVIAEFSAVVPMAAPMAFLSFFGRRRLMIKKNRTAVAAEIRPRIIPDAPVVRMVFTSVFAPIEIVMKKVTMGCAVLQVSRKFSSRLPQTKPISSGMKFGHSGPAADLLKAMGLNAENIVNKARAAAAGKA